MAGIRKDVEQSLISQAKQAAAKTTQKAASTQKKIRKTKPPLSKKLKSGEPKEVYMQLCEDIAERMADTVSGRDYSSMSKSFLDAFKNYQEAVAAENEDTEEIPSAIATLQIQLQNRTAKHKQAGDGDDAT